MILCIGLYGCFLRDVFIAHTVHNRKHIEYWMSCWSTIWILIQLWSVGVSITVSYVFYAFWCVFCLVNLSEKYHLDSCVACTKYTKIFFGFNSQESTKTFLIFISLICFNFNVVSSYHRFTSVDLFILQPFAYIHTENVGCKRDKTSEPHHTKFGKIHSF